MTGDEQAIRELVERWMKASREGDTETVLGLMTEDVVFLVPGREPFGKEQFARDSQGFAGVEIDGRGDIEELRVVGDWAFIRNRLQIAVTPPGGETIRRAGYALTLLRKEEDGQWRLARDANLVG